MKVCILNGSPKGKYSVTLQTLLYLEKKFKEYEFEVVNIGQQIKVIEKDINPIVSKMLESEYVLIRRFIHIGSITRSIKVPCVLSLVLVIK